MAERKFEFCVLDPEGDYDELEDAVSVGDASVPPQTDDALKLIERSETNVVVNTQCFTPGERPAYFARLLPRIEAVRARTGRPHWLLIDEAHHLLPAGRGELRVVLPDRLPGVVLITVHPETLAADVLKTVRTVVALGDDAHGVVSAVCAAAGVGAPADVPTPGDDEVVVFEIGAAQPPFLVRAYPPRQHHHRHTRKYAEGNLGEERSFYFRGPREALNLRAHNLMLFVEMADGVDDDTWEHHRRARDYSTWFRDAIKDQELADETAAIEADEQLDAKHSREAIGRAVRRRYTAPSAAVGQ